MNLKDILDQKGVVEYTLEQNTFKKLDIEKLEKEVFKEKEFFEIIEKGDTDESSSLGCLRIKTTNVDLYNSSCVERLLSEKEFISFMEGQTNLKNIEIDRCQAHIYQKGDFLSIHNDTDSCPDYKYSCLLFFSNDYEGGEFKVYNHEICQSFKPRYGTLLVLKSGLMHEVCRVTKGMRKVIAFFIKGIV